MSINLTRMKFSSALLLLTCITPFYSGYSQCNVNDQASLGTCAGECRTVTICDKSTLAPPTSAPSLNGHIDLFELMQSLNPGITPGGTWLPQQNPQAFVEFPVGSGQYYFNAWGVNITSNGGNCNSYTYRYTVPAGTGGCAEDSYADLTIVLGPYAGENSGPAKADRKAICSDKEQNLFNLLGTTLTDSNGDDIAGTTILPHRTGGQWEVIEDPAFCPTCQIGDDIPVEPPLVYGDKIDGNAVEFECTSQDIPGGYFDYVVRYTLPSSSCYGVDCPGDEAKIVVRVYRKAKEGTQSCDLEICEKEFWKPTWTEQWKGQSYDPTNFDLFTLFDREDNDCETNAPTWDAGGRWGTDAEGEFSDETGEINPNNTFNDSFVNLYNLYEIYKQTGQTEFEYDYSVTHLHGLVCDPLAGKVKIKIKPIEFNPNDATVLVTPEENCPSNLCAEPFVITVTETDIDPTNGEEYEPVIPSGSYTIKYRVVRDIDGVVVIDQTAIADDAANGTNGSFDISDCVSALSEEGFYTVEIYSMLYLDATCPTPCPEDPVVPCNDGRKCTVDIYNPPLTVKFLIRTPDARETTLSVNPDPVCATNDVTVTITDTNPGANEELSTGNYTVTYTLSGANTLGETEAQMTGYDAVTGTGTFVIDGEPITNDGTTTITITKIVYENGCEARLPQPYEIDFEVLEGPVLADPAEAVISPSPYICEDYVTGGGDVTFGIQNASLIDGTYTLTYNIDGGADQTGDLTFVGGNSTNTITVSNALFNNGAGTYTVTLTGIILQGGNGCTSSVTMSPFAIIISENPDLAAITATPEDPICGETTAVININTTSLSDGTYIFTYDLSGANTASGETANVTISGGEGQIDIPVNLLPNTGTTTITVTRVENAETGCATELPFGTDFDIIDVPDTTGFTISVDEPICTGSNAVVHIIGANNLTEGTGYNIYYTLSGANGDGVTEHIVNNAVFAGGAYDFTIDTSLIPNYGVTTITVTGVQSINTTCRANVDFPASFRVIDLTQGVSVGSVCEGETATVTITSLPDGTYTIDYTLSAPNAGNGSASVTVAGGTGSFTVTLANAGITTITLSTNTVNGACTGDVDVTVHSRPNVAGASISIADICAGETAEVVLNFTNTADGTYTVTYNINGGADQTEDVTFTSGAGNFSLGTQNTAGTYTLTITSVQRVGEACIINTNISDTFVVNPLPDTTGLIVTVADICFDQNLAIAFSNGILADGNYQLDYTISGANNITASINVDFTGGNGGFIIPAAQFTSAGANTFTLDVITFNATGCSTTTTINDTFNVNSPAAPTFNGVSTFCIQDEPTLANITSFVESGTITWYDAPTGGTALAETDALEHQATYYAAITDATGCISAERTPVTVDLSACAEIRIPDGFSPNGDGKNDEYYINYIEVLYPNYVLEIYNRYGNMVYKGDKNTPRFNGKPNQGGGSDVLPVGTYFYIVYFNDADNTKPVQGSLYLSR